MSALRVGPRRRGCSGWPRESIPASFDCAQDSGHGDRVFRGTKRHAGFVQPLQEFVSLEHRLVGAEAGQDRPLGVGQGPWSGEPG